MCNIHNSLESNMSYHIFIMQLLTIFNILKLPLKHYSTLFTLETFWSKLHHALFIPKPLADKDSLLQFKDQIKEI